jgi:hypothetical protein
VAISITTRATVAAVVDPRPFVGPCPLFQFLNVHTVGGNPWTGDQPVARPLLTYKTTRTQNKRTQIQISMPRVGFEFTIPAFEGAKSVHASDRAAIAIGRATLRREIKSYHLFLHTGWTTGQ